MVHPLLALAWSREGRAIAARASRPSCAATPHLFQPRCNTMQQNATLIANRRVVSHHGGPSRVASTNMHKDAHRKRSWPPGRGHGRTQRNATECNAFGKIGRAAAMAPSAQLSAGASTNVHNNAHRNDTANRQPATPMRRNATQCNTFRVFAAGKSASPIPCRCGPPPRRPGMPRRSHRLVAKDLQPPVSGPY